MKKLALSFLLVVFVLTSLPALDDSLFLSSTPIVYGEEDFIRRVEEKAGDREPVGLVLTGGSARALAHIGVLRYLEENSIVPDFIIGNSMGSIVGLLYAYGLSPDQILYIFESVDIGSLFDLNLPVGQGLVSTDRFINFLKSYLGEEVRLEELKIPVIAMCEDLVTKRSVLLCEGDFYTALLGSFALPVYFSSVSSGEHLLVDGGIANIAPVNFAYRYTDNVIVSTTFYSNPDLNLKNAITALNVSIDIGKRRSGMSEILEHPELTWIRCNVESFSFMQFSAGLELAQRGYESCFEVSEELSRYSNEGVTEELLAFRVAMDEKIEKETVGFGVFNFAPSRSFSFSAPIIEGKSFGRGSEMSYYRDDTSLGTGIKIAKGGFTGLLTVGGVFSLDTENFYIKPVLSVDLTEIFLTRFELKGNFSWYFDKSYSGIQSLRYVFSVPENLFLSFGEKFEAYSSKPIIISLFAELGYDNESFNSSLEIQGGYMGSSLFGVVNGGLDFVIPNTAFSAETEATVLFKENSTYTEGGLHISYNMEGDFTFGEMFIFSETKVGLYALASSEKPIISEAGVSFSTNMGLIGLRNIPINVLLGYKFDTNTVHFAFKTQL